MVVDDDDDDDDDEDEDDDEEIPRGRGGCGGACISEASDGLPSAVFDAVFLVLLVLLVFLVLLVLLLVSSVVAATSSLCSLPNDNNVVGTIAAVFNLIFFRAT